VEFFLKFNQFEKSLLVATGVCLAVVMGGYPVMTGMGMSDELAVMVTINFARSGGVILFIALGSAMYRYMRPVKPGEEPGEGAWDPDQAPKPSAPSEDATDTRSTGKPVDKDGAR
jgi:hypothetical protein